MFNFRLGNWEPKDFGLELEDTDQDKDTKGTYVTVGSFKKGVETIWQYKSEEYKKYCDGVIWTDAQGMGTTNLTVYLKFKFKPEVEVDNPDQEYQIQAPLQGIGKWIN